VHPRDRSEEPRPAQRAEEERSDPEEDARGEPPPVRGRELAADLPEIEAAQEEGQQAGRQEDGEGELERSGAQCFPHAVRHFIGISLASSARISPKKMRRSSDGA